MSPEVMRSWKITAVINRLLDTPMSGTRKRRVESMHEREDKGEGEAAGGGVDKLVTDDSESCDWMQVFFLRLVPC